MSVKRIKVTNFKNFKELEIEFSKFFNILIGANASGKSNFVQIFRFLRDIANSGLDNAVSMQGGVEYLRNINIGASENFSLKLVFDQEFGFSRRMKKGSLGIKIYETTYEFALKFRKRGSGFEIAKDNLTQKFRLEKQKGKIAGKEKLGQGEIILSCANGKVKIDLHKPENIPIKEDDIYPPFLREGKLPPKALLFQTPFFFMPFVNI